VIQNVHLSKNVSLCIEVRRKECRSPVTTLQMQLHRPGRMLILYYTWQCQMSQYTSVRRFSMLPLHSPCHVSPTCAIWTWKKKVNSNPTTTKTSSSLGTKNYFVTLEATQVASHTNRGKRKYTSTLMYGQLLINVYAMEHLENSDSRLSKVVSAKSSGSFQMDCLTAGYQGSTIIV